MAGNRMLRAVPIWGRVGLSRPETKARVGHTGRDAVRE